MGHFETLNRRDFLAGLGGIFINFTADVFQPYLPETTDPVKPFSLQEIIDKYPAISPGISAVNISYIPNCVEGVYCGFHKLDPSEAIFISVPFDDKLFEKKAVVFPGIKEAIARNQPAYLVLDLPFPKDSNSAQQYASWPEKIQKLAGFFKGKSTVFIIGNELNIENSVWGGKLEKYLQLYLQAYQTIKKVSPESRVFPWQEAYNQNGETLKIFLKMLFQKGGTIDGLAVNIYDISSKIQPRVEMYQQLLNTYGLAKTPIVISELSMPEKPNYYHFEEKSSFVVQHLVTAAYLQQQGLIERAAWFSGFVPGCDPQHLSLSTSDENGIFERDKAFNAFVLCQHFLAGDEIIKSKDSDGLVRFDIWEKEKLKASFLWNEGKNTISLTLASSQYRHAFKPVGRKLPLSRKTILSPPRNPVYTVGNTVVLAT